jgi:hypothetical protein
MLYDDFVASPLEELKLNSNDLMQIKRRFCSRRS